MARDIDTIQAEIERAREALAISVDELTYRANPKRLVAEGKHALVAKIEQPNIKYPLIGVGLVMAAIILRKIFR